MGGEGVLRCRLLDMGLDSKNPVQVEKVAPLATPSSCGSRDYALSLRKEKKLRNIQVEVTQAWSFALAGSRNFGREATLFNQLTGSNQHVRKLPRQQRLRETKGLHRGGPSRRLLHPPLHAERS